MQAAYKFGKITHIAPIQISLSVIFPLVCSYFIYHKSISIIQDLLIAAIAICCYVMLQKHEYAQ